MTFTVNKKLKAFTVNNGSPSFIVFLFRDPHLLEGGQRSQDRSSNPYRVFTLRRSNNLDFHCGWGEGCDFLLHSVGDSWEHGGATRQDCVGVQILTDVHITLHDRIVRGLVDACRFHSKEGGLEHGLRTSESLVGDSDDLPIRKLVALLQAGTGCSGIHFSFEIQSNINQFLFDVTHDLPFGSGGKGVATLGQNLHQVVGQVSAGQIETNDSMGKSVTLVDGNSVRYTITAVHDNSRGPPGSVQRQHSLDGDVHGWCVEGFEHDLLEREIKLVSF